MATAAPFSFFWHDYETFGTHPGRDRPSQFAGVRTDADLNEIEAPLMLYCQPAPDTLPQPQACLLTGITPQHCLQNGVIEAEFAARIEAALSQPGTVGVGYNSIRFDDEVTRHLLWRNLADPYAREWQNGCGRWDLLDVMRLARALRPQGLNWPTREDGTPSYKLEHLTAANGVVHTQAHDALADVRATIALAKALRRAQPKLWEFALKLRSKHEVVAEMGVGRPFLHVSSRYPAQRGCMALVWPMAPHPQRKNEIIVWDLSEDPGVLFSLNAAQVRERLFTRADALPQGVTRLPIKTIHLNRSPMVVGNLKTLSPHQAAHWGLDLALGHKHAQIAERGASQLAGLWMEVFETPPRAPGARDVDEDLYGGFLGNEDRRQLQRLRAMPPQELAQRQPAFDDERLEELVFRYRARNFPQSLTEAEQQRWTAHCTGRLLRGEGGVTPLAEYLETLDTLAEEADERGQEILEALVDYATTIAPDSA
jgi:exodeoxyribonuclease I